jgi:hypothetical protein
MAANDYYNASQPPRLPPTRPMSSLAFDYNTPTKPAPANFPRPNFYESQNTSAQSVPESIPPKKQKVYTRHDQSQYPRSPDSSNPQLLPDSKGRKKMEGSFGNYFKGKIPWVVYTLSLIQVSVFIAEIIKNCEYSCAGENYADNL